MKQCPRIRHITFSLLAAAFLFPVHAAQSLRVKMACEECSPSQLSSLDSALRANATAHGMVIVPDSALAPQLEVFAFPSQTSWELTFSVNSPHGDPVQVSQEAFPEGLSKILSRGLQAVVVQAKTTIEAAIARAKAAQEKKGH